MSNEIKGFKLSNFADVIGKEVKVTDTHYHIEDAFFLRSSPQEDGSLIINYVPLTMLGSPEGNKNHMGFDVELPKNSVLFSFKLNEGIIQRYLSYVSPLDLSMAPSVL